MQIEWVMSCRKFFQQSRGVNSTQLAWTIPANTNETVLTSIDDHGKAAMQTRSQKSKETR